LIRQLAALTDGVYDLLILGGGITGAGVALDAALRGYRVVLIDKGDFASGTSSVSSKLVHGGLRYLEHAEFHLVYEALHERGLLLQNAPHLVHPLRFVIPFYQGARVPPWKWRVGLTLYDLLAGAGNIHRSQPLPLSRIEHEFPDLQRTGLHGGAAYFDAQMDDARLCLEVIHSAAQEGAVVANYAEAVAFERNNGVLSAVRVRDHFQDRELVIRARHFLNAAGPWGDHVRTLAGDDSGPMLQPTKGVHAIAPDRGLKAAFLLLHPDDGRVFFVIPWMRKTLIGTTDTEYVQSPDALTVTDDDLAYLLKGFNHHFTTPLERNSLLGSFVGLRPLLRARPSDPSARSREFRIFTSPSGLVSVSGGKYTTYRQMAQTVTDRLAERLGKRQPCRTRHYRLHGAPHEPWSSFASTTVAQLISKHSLPEAAARHLVFRYGQKAADVAAYLDQDPALAQQITAEEPDLRAELRYQRDHELAVHPADHLLRRTRLGLFHPHLLKQPLAVG
jgi:glycerol-3-phosphate dehydrogenase